MVARRITPKTRWFIGIGVIVLVAAGVYFIQNFVTPPQPELGSGYNADNPDEQKPGKNYRWRGQPHEPKYIRMPSIQVEGYIQKVGLGPNKEIAAPTNIHMAGWYQDTPPPGGSGLSIIDGHVDGRTVGGIFKELARLRPGDRFTVAFGNGSMRQFEVLGVLDVPSDTAINALFSQEPKVSSQLNLITCSGDFNAESRRYSNRVIVSSKAL